MIVDDITDVNHRYQSLMSQGDKHETPLSLSLTLSLYIYRVGQKTGLYNTPVFLWIKTEQFGI